MLTLILSNLLASSASGTVVPSAYANFPAYGKVQSISGFFTFQIGDAGTGVLVTSTTESGVRGFPDPDVLGPFLWHSRPPPMIGDRLMTVHEYAIPEDNPICDAAGLHFDPDNVGYAEPCYPLTPEKCQVRNSMDLLMDSLVI